MSTRDDAIKAVQVAALKKRMDGLTTWEAGVVVDAVDPITRADEREQHPSIFEVVQSTCGHRWVGSADEGVACPVCEDAGVMTRRALTDLVAALAALPSRVELDEVGNEVTWVRYTDVLALLGEEK